MALLRAEEGLFFLTLLFGFLPNRLESVVVRLFG